MKLPKIVKRYCPTCKKHTECKTAHAKKKTPGKAHPLSAGGKKRARIRGLYGTGNHGRRSRKAVSAWKATGKKLTKKTDLRYECKVCKKMHNQAGGIRAKKVEFQ